MQIRFYLHRRIRSDGKKRIMCQYSHISDRYRFSTKQSVLPEAWDNKKQRAKPKYPLSESVNIKLNAVERALHKAITGLARDEIATTIHNVRDRYENRTAAKLSFWDAYDRFRDEKLSQLSSGSRKNYGSTEAAIKDFERTGAPIVFERMDISWISRFRTFLHQEKGNIEQTVSGKVKNLKAFMRYAEKSGWHSNSNYRDWKVSFRPSTEAVYLTMDEINLIQETEFDSDRKNRIRDLLLLHCFTGLRYSEGQDIEIKAIRDGTLTYYEQKTSSIKTRPISKRAQAIIEKYKGFPSYSNQKFNEYAKEVCKEVGIDDSVFSSGEWVPKWSQVTTHTGRSSFVTNMLLNNVPLTVVQRIVGHASARTTAGYDRSGAKEESEAIHSVWDE